MVDKWAVPGELGLIMEAYGGAEIARLKPEDIVKDVTSVKLLQTHLVTTLYRLYEASEEMKLLREQRESLRQENTLLRANKARYEEIESKGYVEMLLSVILGFAIAYAQASQASPTALIFLGLSLVAVLCSASPRLLRLIVPHLPTRKGGQK